MCGIAGIVSTRAIDPTTITSMTEALKHRGPDAQGTFLVPSQMMALGHTRLSIIDLSSSANQPFHSRDGRYTITFNGEIYNFPQLRRELEESGVLLRTQSDTEIIIEGFALWGAQLFGRLRGMFAAAILDQREQRMLLFRDRLGKKPMYYTHADGLFVFASEIKALLQHPAIKARREVNPEAVNAFLHLGFIPAPMTIFSHIHKFPAGHYGEVTRDLNLTTQPYWRLEEHLRSKPAPEGDVRGRLGALLEEAVRERLIGDVPVGAFLSGGLDSSLVCALAMRHVSKPLKTFSIGFKESRFDESPYSRAVAKHLKTEHTEHILSEQEALIELETYLHHFDEPFADTSAIPTLLVSKLARRDVTVALTGDGGDELFLGYGAYSWAQRLSLLRWRLASQPLRWLLQVSGQSRWERISRLLERPSRGGLRSHIFSQEQYFFTQDEIHQRLLKGGASSEFRYDDPQLAHSLTPRERQALFDLRYYLPDDLLVKVDMASMFHALECRCPFLDHRVVEFALSLEESFKVREGKTKWILKELLRQHLPESLIERPKRGFSIPLAAWMKGELRYLTDDLLSEKNVKAVGLCEPAFVKDLLAQFMSGREYLHQRLWVLIVLHKWWRENL